MIDNLRSFFTPGLSSRESKKRRRRTVQLLRAVEGLETRCLLSFTPSLSGAAVTFSGTWSHENLTLKTSTDVGSVGDLAFSNDNGATYSTDLSSATDVQSIKVADITSLTINASNGNDVIAWTGLTGAAPGLVMTVNGGSGSDTFLAGPVNAVLPYASGDGPDVYVNNPDSTTTISVASGAPLFLYSSRFANPPVVFDNGVDAINFNGGAASIVGGSNHEAFDFTNVKFNNASNNQVSVSTGGNNDVVTTTLDRSVAVTYDGGSQNVGNSQDVAQIAISDAELANPAVQTQLAGYQKWLADGKSAQPYTLAALSTTLVNFEAMNVVLTGCGPTGVYNLVAGTVGHDSGGNTINGTAFNDLILGFGGDDVLNGLGGNDVLVGGPGIDTMNGGEGSDWYVFYGNQASSDQIADSGTDNPFDIDTLVAITPNTAINVRGLGAAAGIEVISAGCNTGVIFTGDANHNTGATALDLRNVTLDGIVYVDALGGDDEIYTSNITPATYYGGGINYPGSSDNDRFYLGNQNVTLLYPNANNGFDTFTRLGTGQAIVKAVDNNVVIGISTFYNNEVSEFTADSRTGVTIVGSGGAHNVFDFSHTTLTGIKEINTGGGNDTVTTATDHDDAVTYDGGSYTGDKVRIAVSVAELANPTVRNQIAAYKTWIATPANVGTPFTISSLKMTLVNFEYTDTVLVQGDCSINVADYNLIVGTNGSDNYGPTILNGTPGNDLILGLGGNDTINGGDGDDVIIGGQGGDTLNGGAGNDTFLVGPGDIGDDTINGGDGIDVVMACADNVAINLGSGYINGVETITANGHSGVTIIGATTGATFNFSTTTLIGIVSINGSGANDTIIGSVGDDVMIGGKGNDTLNGGKGNDTFLVGPGDGVDAFTGGDGTDVVKATKDGVAIGLSNYVNGVETITADDHSGVTIVGAAGGSTLIFSNTTLTGIVSINGLGGNDTITGSAGDDVINGGAGNDVINGGDGNDTINGGIGSDTLTGGAGADVFVFDPADTADDTITDFVRGTDKINLVAYFTTFDQVVQTGANPLVITVTGFGPKKIKLNGNTVVTPLDQSDFIFAV